MMGAFLGRLSLSPGGQWSSVAPKIETKSQT